MVVSAFLRSLSKIVLLSLVTGIAPASMALANAPDNLRFEVFLDDEPIGIHSFSFEKRGAETVMRSNAAFDVKVLFFNAYRYRHQSTERWSDGCLIDIRAHTDANGETSRVVGESQAGTLRISGGERPVRIPGCAMSFAYWDPRILDQARLLNPQSGEWVDVAVVADGRDTLDGWRTAGAGHALSTDRRRYRHQPLV